MKTKNYYLIINGLQATVIKAENMDEARERSLLFCDLSQEVIIREIEALRNTTLIPQERPY